MKSKAIQFLESHEAATPSTFLEEAKARERDEIWLRWSRGIAMKVIDYMQDHALSRNDLAEELGVSPQYVSKILSGHINFSLKSIADLEAKLHMNRLVAIAE